ncbi:MAG TPA: hypothetical protein VJT10_19960 [Steroidobacteraceae bacterium]|nr:hypothetical protein [Steroidobacteraceae bacterium]
MERGVIVGGGLMAASFLVAVVLNRSAHKEIAPSEAVRQPPVQVCEDSEQRLPRTAPVRKGDPEKCRQSPAESAQR